jgi:hypothetical protein
MGRKRKKTEGSNHAGETEGRPKEPRPPEAAYNAFLDAARALDRRDLLPMRGDAKRAHDNAQRGVSAVLEREATIQNELPRMPVHELRQLPEIALALLHAEKEIERAEIKAERLDDLSRRAKRLRKRLLKWASSLARKGAVSEAELGTIGRGQGGDAEDCVTLARVLAPHLEASRKDRKKKDGGAISPRRVAEAAEVGAELARELGPGDRPDNGGTPPDVEGAVEMRDRLWTLLNERYRDVWRVGAYLFGPSVDDRLPTLQSRKGPKKRLAKA